MNRNCAVNDCQKLLFEADIQRLRQSLSAAGINLTTASILIRKLGSDADAKMIEKAADQVIDALGQ